MLSKPAKTTTTINGKYDNSHSNEETDSHANAKIVTLFSIEAEMANADSDNRHFLNISDVEEEKQTRLKVKKG